MLSLWSLTEFIDCSGGEMNQKLAKGLFVAILVIFTCWVVITHNKTNFRSENIAERTEDKGAASLKTSISKEFDINEVIVPEQIDDEALRLIGNGPGEQAVLQEVRKFWIGRIKDNFEPVFRILHKYIKNGDTVADIGCGAGWYTFYLSQLVGETGRVFAVDTNPIAFLSQGIYRKEMAKKYGEDKFRNITPILNEGTSMFLGKNVIDVGYLSDVHILHINMGEVVTDPDGKTRNIELEKIEKIGREKQQKELLEHIDKDQKAFIRKVHEALKDKGIFIVAEDMKPPLDKTKLDKKNVIELMKNNGFKLKEDACFTDYHLIVFEKK